MASSDKPYTTIKQASVRVDSEQVEQLVREYLKSERVPGLPADLSEVTIQTTSDGRLTAVARWTEQE